MKALLTRSVGMIMALTLAFCLATPAPGEEGPEQFYKGKTVRWIFSSDPGRGGDLIARSVAPFLEKAIGATVKYENMGTNEGVNWVYQRGSKDGLTLVGKAKTALLANDLLKAPGVRYEAEKYLYLTDINPAAFVLAVSAKSSYRTLDDLRRAKSLKAGASSAKGALATTPAVVFEILGLNGKVITGYKGSAGVRTAVMRGEVDLMTIEGSSIAAEVKEGELVPLFALPDGGSEVFPDLPSLVEFGANVPADLKDALDFVSAGGLIVAMPPGVPQDRVDYMRRVFERLDENKELRATLLKLRGAQTDFINGKQVQDYMVRLKGNQALGAQLDGLLKKYTVIR